MYYSRFACHELLIKTDVKMSNYDTQFVFIDKVNDQRYSTKHCSFNISGVEVENGERSTPV